MLCLGLSGKEDGKDSNHKPKARMSFKAASQATLSFLSARKRIEDGLKNWNKRRLSKRDGVEGLCPISKDQSARDLG